MTTTQNEIMESSKGSTVHRLPSNPGNDASLAEGQLYLRDTTTVLKQKGVFDVVEGREHPDEKLHVDRNLPIVTASSDARLHEWRDTQHSGR